MPQRSGSPIPDSSITTDQNPFPAPADSGNEAPGEEANPGGGGDDAVCFTAGLKGAYFGAGVIHAYLAARRKHPVITAGISAGALNAAALQKCFRELKDAPPTPANTGDVKERLDADKRQRWSWFRNYVHLLTDNPLSVVWDAIPDISDFFADMPPIRDNSLRPKDKESQARQQRYILIKLGRRLASLPISVRRATETIVNYVRTREGYGTLSPIRLLVRIIYLIFRLGMFGASFSSDNFYRNPRPIKVGASEETKGPRDAEEEFEIWPRPLFGWPVFSVALMIFIAGAALMLSALAGSAFFLWRNWNLLMHDHRPLFWWPAGAGAVLLWIMVRGIADIQIFTPEYSLRNKIWAVIKLAPAWFITTMAIAALVLQRDQYLHLKSVPLLVSAALAAVSLRVIVPGLAGQPILRSAFKIRWNFIHFLQWLAPWVTLTLIFIGFSLTWSNWSQQTQDHSYSFFQNWLFEFWHWGFAAFLILLVCAVCGVLLTYRSQTADAPDANLIGWAGGVLLKNVKLRKSLLSDFYGVHRLKEMFDTKAASNEQGDLFTEVDHRLCNCLAPLDPQTAACKVCGKAAVGNQRACECPAQADTQSGRCTVCGESQMPLLIVAAPLQALPSVPNYPATNQQVWASPGEKLVRALRAALGPPGLVEPVSLDTKKDQNALRCWISGDTIKRVDLVDGAVVRQNPLPALFSFLNKNKAVAQQLCEGALERKSVHVVFGVPLKPRQEKPTGGKPGNHNGDSGFSEITGTPEAPLKAPANVVDVGLLSLQLAKRRDTRLEVRQTNFIGELEATIIRANGQSSLTHWKRAIQEQAKAPSIESLDTLPILADSVAPDEEIDLGNKINPDPKKCLEAIAEGCRQMLQRLYAEQIPQPPETIPCPMLLAKIWNVNAEKAPDLPGLAEVCSHCTQSLQRQEEGTERRKKSGQPAREFLKKDFPQLTGEQPRIIFVASGGVFRGAFQIGVLAALLKAGVKVDLVVGASVGTLMGGALAAAQTAAQAADWNGALGVISELVSTFIDVDKRIALTTTLKSATRELGQRGRSIHLSPNELQRMVRRGSQFDAGFAVAGAPPALLDAISTLLAIPYDKTKDIAGQLVAGHVSQALNLLRKAVGKETLTRLGIEEFIMGTSLLQDTARRLLFPGGLDGREAKPQPYLDANGNGVALLATTTNLLTWESKLLGRPGEFNGSYNFIEAALSSSAFPAVFRPRRETDVFPGFGDPKVVYADGGLFDNLPFFPAMDVLSSVQQDHIDQGPSDDSGSRSQACLRFLRERYDHPDLFIAGSLDADPDSDVNKAGPFKSILAVRKRAMLLDANLKIKDFELASTRVHAQIGRLLDANPENLSEKEIDLMNGAVDAAILPVFPTDQQHLNGTFSFCKTLGLRDQRIHISVADGCFQTLATLAKAQSRKATDVKEPSDLLSKSVMALVEAGKIPQVAAAEISSGARFRLRATIGNLGASGHQPCPFFLKKELNQSEPQPFYCPFTEMTGENSRRIFTKCRSDRTHADRIIGWQDATRPGAAKPPTSSPTDSPDRTP